MRPRFSFEIFLISLAAILLEISSTRVFSFKLIYYFTYVILGIALLGLGAGGVSVSMIGQARRTASERMVPLYCLVASAGVLVSYVTLVWLPVNAFRAVAAISDGGLHDLLWEGGKLAFLCSVVFLPFFGAGLAISTILATNAERVGRLYFYDLSGAGIGCALAVPLMIGISPPGCILLAGTLFAVAGLPLLRGQPAQRLTVGLPLLVAATTTLVGVGFHENLPDPIVDDAKTMGTPKKVFFSRWHPVFRVDVISHMGGRMISHDGTWGAVLPRFDGDLAKLARYDGTQREYPFRLVDHPRVAIIGAAGGNEILAALHFGASHITAVELNPVTVSLLTDHYLDFTGRIAEHESVTLVNAEGRSFLMASKDSFDVMWFVTPDSYAAMNAASSGGHVLSESYLYTVEMLLEALEHLRPDGIIVTQFGGERDPRTTPALSARYLATAREAFRRRGVDDFDHHVMLATYRSFPRFGSTIILKRSAITERDIERFTEYTGIVANGSGRVEFSWQQPPTEHPYDRVVRSDRAQLERWYESYRYEVQPVTDDAPFFWHVVRFRTALLESFEPVQQGHESGVGERLLALLLVITTLLAALFLFAPLRLRRDVWRQLPAKGASGVFFAAIGTGFMFLEVSLIQRLTLLLGYPTYSLTVTLFAILLSTGVGSLLSGRIHAPTARTLWLLIGALVGLGVFYTLALSPLVELFVGSPLPVRVFLAVALVTPLGLCLGVFMPVGLGAVAGLSTYREEYVAWAWAINGFFSVISSLLSSMLSMMIGFTMVMWVAIALYATGTAALARIVSEPRRRDTVASPDPEIIR